MGLKVNFADVEDSNYEALPSGTYTVNITDAEQRESKSSDFEYINWEFTIVDDPNPKMNGRKAWANTTLNPKGLFGLKGLLSAAGYDVDGEIDFEIDDVVGKKIKIVTNQREYNGDTQTNIKRYKAVGDSSSDGSSSSVLP